MKALGSKTMQPCEKTIREYKQTGEMWNEWKNKVGSEVYIRNDMNESLC